MIRLFFFFAYLIQFSLWGEVLSSSPLPSTYFEDLEKEKALSNESGLGIDRFLLEMIQMLLILGVILAVMWIGAWFVKKMLNTRIQQMNSGSTLKVLERRALSAKAILYLVEWNGKELLIGESATGLSKLAELESETDRQDFHLSK